MARTSPRRLFASPSSLRGVGIYIRRLLESRHGTPEEASDKAVQHGLSFVAILACWQDSRRGHMAVNLGEGPSYAEAFRSKGLDVWTWGYPQAGKEAAFIKSMDRACVDWGAVGMVLDPEVSYKNRPDDMAKLLRLADATGIPYVITSFGLTSHSMPWDEMGGRGVAGSPQIYTVPLSVAVRIINDWRALGWDRVVVSAPTFGKRSGPHLRRYLEKMLPHADGFILWSWRSTRPQEWAAIADVAAVLARREPKR